MIRRAFAFAHLAVDPGGGALCSQDVGQQHMIDAQPQILLEAEHPVIPPGEAFFGLLEQPETVFEAQRQQAAEGRTLGIGTKNLPGP